ncbi:general substrate transporter [Trichoderma citrinoviride]|uniref:General substrate transporter n=1 Tax=Trichoderma citrinoviride TaxID=58853 RepID=A0A2T4BGH7_9HYPO|nr:general substrate transporter [Trichoderma citrinoviride]PTB68430.1 general substrate transporter [Trichoderma citrinoviride]
MAGDTSSVDLSVGYRLKQFNSTILFIMLYMCSCAFNFGYDVGNFGGVQGMQSFGKRFGECNEAGVCKLPPWLSSLMTSLPFLGKALGAIACGPIAERFGRKMCVLVLACLSFIGVLLQTTATTSAQFTVGRFISFAMTGMSIVVVPIYLSETSPKVLRGMMTSTLQLMIVFGQLVASLVTFGTQHISGDKGWQIPVGLQFIAPALIVGLLPLVPESPRWLLSQSKVEEAKVSLRRLYKNHTEAEIEQEIDILRHAHSTEQKGSWAEVFNVDNRKRTMVAVIAMFGQQITGQAFSSQYSVVFYQSQGYKSQAFLFNILSNVTGLVCLITTWFLIDQVGRRPMLMIGGSGMAIFLFVVGGVGLEKTPNDSERGALVASFILFTCAYNLSWAPVSYVVVSEAASTRVKEKTNLFASVISIITTFVTSFTIPYLLNAPYANLGAKVGFIYGSINWVMVGVAYFFIPEMKGRSLEEVDELFAAGTALRDFSKTRTTPSTTYIEDTARKQTPTDET